MCELTKGPIPTATAPLTLQTGAGGLKVLVSNFSQPAGDLRTCQQSRFEDTLAGCEVMQQTMVQLSPEPQFSECRSSKICAVSTGQIATVVMTLLVFYC